MSLTAGSTVAITFNTANVSVTVTPQGQGATTFSTSNDSVPRAIETIMADNARGAGPLASISIKLKDTNKNVAGLSHIEF